MDREAELGGEFLEEMVFLGASPCACKVAIHWQSLMSVLRPGRFFTCLPLVTTTWKPAASSTSVDRQPVDARGLQWPLSPPLRF